MNSSCHSQAAQHSESLAFSMPTDTVKKLAAVDQFEKMTKDD
jgi:hypothetical protein